MALQRTWPGLRHALPCPSSCFSSSFSFTPASPQLLHSTLALRHHQRHRTTQQRYYSVASAYQHGAAPAASPVASSSTPSSSDWVTVIGLEVHTQLLCASKLFSSGSTQFGATPNTNATFIDTALPGTLPSLNQAAIAQVIRLGLSLGSAIHSRSQWERKHYFYADLPQGYQITQQKYPMVTGGSITLDNETLTRKRPSTGKLSAAASRSPARSSVRVGISRLQLEQDSGKTLHDQHPQHSYVDLNRAGVALIEIVSEPDLRSSHEAAVYIRKLTSILRALKISNARMEEGSLRCDVNISVFQPATETAPAIVGDRVEIKNLNSLRSVQLGIEYEVARQIELLAEGKKVERETRGFDLKNGKTFLLRSKESMLDYRFLPEPDLPPLFLSSSYIDSIRSTLPELPDQLLDRFQRQYGLSLYDSKVILSMEGGAEYFEKLVCGEGHAATLGQSQENQLKKTLRNPKMCANWMMNEVVRLVRKKLQNAGAATALANDDDEDDVSGGGALRGVSFSPCAISSADLGEIIDLVDSSSISGKGGRLLLEKCFEHFTATQSAAVSASASSSSDLPPSPPSNVLPPLSIPALVSSLNLRLVRDPQLITELCSAVIKQFPVEVADVAAGKQRKFGFLCGAVLQAASQKKLAGELDPVLVSQVMQQMIAANKH